MMNADQKRTLQGEFYQAANRHKTYEVFYATSNILFEIGNILVTKFGCTRLASPVLGLDTMITKYRKENIELDLGWDNWSGFYIQANSSEGDNLVKEIGTFLNTIINENGFEKYVHYW